MLVGDSTEAGRGRSRLLGCSLCHYRTDRKNNLKRHTLTMHQVSAAAGDCCGLVFFSKGELRAHTQLCHRDGYLCGICGHPFTRKALLRRHLSVHTGVREFSCPLCTYQSSNKSNVERHLRVHQRQWKGSRLRASTSISTSPPRPLPPPVLLLPQVSESILVPKEAPCSLPHQHILPLADTQYYPHFQTKPIAAPATSCLEPTLPPLSCLQPPSPVSSRSSRRGFSVQELLNDSWDEKSHPPSARRVSLGGMTDRAPVSTLVPGLRSAPAVRSVLLDFKHGCHSEAPLNAWETMPPPRSLVPMPRFSCRSPASTSTLCDISSRGRHLRAAITSWPAFTSSTFSKDCHDSGRPSCCENPVPEPRSRPLSCHDYAYPKPLQIQAEEYQTRGQNTEQDTGRARPQTEGALYLPKKLRACKRFQVKHNTCMQLHHQDLSRQ